MDSEQIFSNYKHRKYNSRNEHSERSSFSDRPYSGYDKYYRQKALLQQIFSNRKLRVVILAILVIVTGILIAIVALLFPLLKNLIDYILENGISGLVGEAGKILEKIWSGNK